MDKKTIEQIAKLARLKITDDEAQQYCDQLDKVLTHFQQISKIDTDGVEPLVTPSEIEIYLRPDENLHEIPTQKIMENAPEKAGNLFKVPPVV